MTRIGAVVVALIIGTSAVVLAPAAHAEDPVVYEVQSAVVATADIEWSDTAGQHSLHDVPLPWRTSVLVADAHSDEARISVTWSPGSPVYPNPGRRMWVTTRIYTKGSQLCAITLDVGASSCTGTGWYADSEVPRR